MSEVGATDRSRLLRYKRAELSGIVTSRKRKLREFFAVCDHEGPIPQVNLRNPDAPPTTTTESHFLDVSDILKYYLTDSRWSRDRVFDEANLPTRRRLRSDYAAQKFPARTKSTSDHLGDASYKTTKSQRGISKPGQSRAGTPGLKSDGRASTPPIDGGKVSGTSQGTVMNRSILKGSQANLQTAESHTATDISIENGIENTVRIQASLLENLVKPNTTENDEVRSGLERRTTKPVVDPQKATSISAGEVSGQSILRVGEFGSCDTPEQPATVYHPANQLQEARIREDEKPRKYRERSGSLSIESLDVEIRAGESLPPPESTVGLNSAATPVVLDISNDTSPDVENNRYDVDGAEHKVVGARAKIDLNSVAEESPKQEERDRVQKAHVGISRAEVLGSNSVSHTNDQLRMDAGATSIDPESEQLKGLQNGLFESANAHTKAAGSIVQFTAGNQDEVDTFPTSEAKHIPLAKTPITDTENQTSMQYDATASESDNRGLPHHVLSSGMTTLNDTFESTVVAEKNYATCSVINKAPVSNSKTIESSNPHLDTQSPPQQTVLASAVTIPTVERMTTRVASGAIRQKSVPEILGEIPRPNISTTADRSVVKGGGDYNSTRNSINSSRSGTHTPAFSGRSIVEKTKLKQRSTLQNVIFPAPKNASASLSANDTALVTGGPRLSKAARDDYLMPLFQATSSANEKKGGPTLESLITSSHKTITTSNASVPILENQTVKVLKRIYNLQSSQKWSLRQPKRAEEAKRPTTHWDVLIQEAKWMRTDFREERKWKMAVASNLAFACAEWVSARPEDRVLLQCSGKPIHTLDLPKETSGDIEMGEGFNDIASQDTPELVSGENDSPIDEDEPRLDLTETVSPAAIFGLNDDDVVFTMNRTLAADKLLNELPMYEVALTIPPTDLPTSELDPDRHWKRSALPLSKYVDGRMELDPKGPPKKKCRFLYDEDDSEDQFVLSEQGIQYLVLAPERANVALFNPEYKHIRDRIHSSHQFRPPSEFPMPLQSFFECRTASQWTWDEDNELKSHVRDFSYNWSLISSMLTSKSLFSSGAERRSPWECFERWIHLEGLPADMQKTQYFRAYTHRIDTANRIVMAAAQQPTQQPNPNGQIQPPRRRTTTSVRVDRRRNQKHLTLVDAMRKLAKKRETSLTKQQHAAGLAAMRKANEVPQARGPLHTPQDFSRLKHEREEQMKERVIQLQQRQEAQRRALLAQQRNPSQNLPQPSLANGGPQQRLPSANGSMVLNGNSSNGQNLTVPGQGRSRQMPSQIPGQPMQNGLRVPQLPMNGVPSVPMLGLQGQLPLPNPALDVGLVARAQNISEQQRQAIRMQQQQVQVPGQSPQIQTSPPRINGMPQPGFQMSSGMVPPYNQNNSNVATPPNGLLPSPGPGQAGSPRMGQTQHSNGISHIQVLEQQLQAKYPSASPDQIKRMIQEHLSKSVHQQQQQRQGLAQSAMNAAAGGAGPNSIASMNPGQGTPQLYAQMLRQQQESQQKAAHAQQQAVNTIGGGHSQQGISTVNGQGSANGNGHGKVQGHAHRGSSGSVQSGK